MDKQDEFLEHVDACKDKFLSRVATGDNVVPFIITHHDADGISAGAIIARALARRNIPFQARVIKQVSEKYLQDIIKPGGKDTVFIFTDFGSGQLSTLARLLPPKDVIILDHHEIDTADATAFGKEANHVNPWLFGIDGATEISGSGVCYLFAKALHGENQDLAYLAVTGALGDMQDKGERASLSGLNRTILNDATSSGLVSESIDIKVFGRFSRPIHLALTYTTDPFIPGLSGDETACLQFLQRIGIRLKHPGTEKPRTIADLSKEEKSTLVSAIIEWALKHGLNPSKTRNLIGNVYILEHENPETNLKDLREFASVLNSCGRLGHGGVGLAIAMGDRKDNFTEGQLLINEYRKRLSNYLDWVQATDAIKRRDNMQVIEGGDYVDDTMIGTLASIVMSSQKVAQDRPVIAWAKVKANPETLKISARGFGPLVEQGLNLGVAIRATLQEIDIDTPGGGHAPAAGCEIPAIKLERFLKVLGRKVAAQLQSGPLPGQAGKKAPSWF